MKALTIIFKYCLFFPFQYPAEKLMTLLGFETENHVRAFCDFHGLTINDTGMVVLKNLVNPDAAYMQHRSITLIESKQGNRSVGEVKTNVITLRLREMTETFTISALRV